MTSAVDTKISHIKCHIEAHKNMIKEINRTIDQFKSRLQRYETELSSLRETLSQRIIDRQRILEQAPAGTTADELMSKLIDLTEDKERSEE